MPKTKFNKEKPFPAPPAHRDAVHQEFIPERAEMALSRILRNAREVARMSPEDLSAATKIPMHHIVAIESDKYAELPPDIYVQGMLRAYAEKFQLDETKLFLMFDHVRRGQVSGARDELPKNRFALSFRPRMLFPKIRMHPVWFFGLAAFLYLAFQARPFFWAPAVVITEPPVQFTATTSSVVVAGRAIGARRVAIHGKEIELSRRGAFRVNLSLVEGLNRIEIIAENYLKKETTLIRYVVFEAPTPVPQPSPGIPEPSEEDAPLPAALPPASPIQPFIPF